MFAMLRRCHPGDDELQSACSRGDEVSPDATAAVATTQLPTTVPLTSPAITLPPDIEVTAVDYEFQGVPEVVPAGTTLKLVNASSKEFHMMLILRLDAGDERTREELTALSVGDILDSQNNARFGRLVSAVLARPGEPQYFLPVGTGKVSEPGRYVIFCLISVGADPAEAAADAEARAPRGERPHYQEGMFAEFSVEG